MLLLIFLCPCDLRIEKSPCGCILAEGLEIFVEFSGFSFYNYFVFIQECGALTYCGGCYD